VFTAWSDIEPIVVKEADLTDAGKSASFALDPPIGDSELSFGLGLGCEGPTSYSGHVSPCRLALRTMAQV
jgi:hypothetical protein